MQLDVVKCRAATQIYVNPLLLGAGTHPSAGKVLRGEEINLLASIEHIYSSERPLHSSRHLHTDAIVRVVVNVVERNALVERTCVVFNLLGLLVGVGVQHVAALLARQTLACELSEVAPLCTIF